LKMFSCSSSVTTSQDRRGQYHLREQVSLEFKL
jgi:hypothetical protein